MKKRNASFGSYQYSLQQDALDAIAAKVGVVAFRPNYHGGEGDKNTVLFYTKEDALYNLEVDRQEDPITLAPKQLIWGILWIAGMSSETTS